MSDGVPQNTHGQGLTFTGQNVVMAIQCLEPTLVWGTPLFWGSGYQTIIHSVTVVYICGTIFLRFLNGAQPLVLRP